MRLSAIVMVAILLTACGAAKLPDNTQREQESAAAIAEFVHREYPDWQLIGTDSKYGCYNGVHCILQLSNGTDSQAVDVVARIFYRPDQSEYWFVSKYKAPVEPDAESCAEFFENPYSNDDRSNP